MIQFELNAQLQNEYENGQVKVAMRMIGHQLLLSAGDSTSRVLAIEKEKESYLISFELGLSIVPDELIQVSDSVIALSLLNSSYLVEVLSCEEGKVEYSYTKEIPIETSMVACSGRLLDSACYQIKITFPTVVKTRLKRKDDLSELGYFIPLILILSFLTYFFQKNRIRLNLNQFISVGNYRFDKINMQLLLGKEIEDLSSKEADLLSLLVDSANSTLDRDHILNVVWKDEGDYVGRTLDVFISKLRKKLENDPEVKIVNIRGVGYKMILKDHGF